MSQSLFVNGKEYLPSTLLSKKFEYTSDYISKLARDEKILATRIGKQWFVEPESLRVFIQETDVKKSLRKDSLSTERKIEREKKNTLNTSELVTPNLALNKYSDFSALAESVAVLMCVLLIGGLSWVTLSSGLGVSDLAKGAHYTIATVAEAVTPNNLYFFDFEIPVDISAALLFDSKKPQHENIVDFFGYEKKNEFGVFTDLPQFLEHPSVDTVMDAEVYPDENVNLSAEEYFSDEVVITEESESYVVQPIFRDSVGNKYDFELVPTASKKLKK